jgi:hypothetical protein
MQVFQCLVTLVFDFPTLLTFVYTVLSVLLVYEPELHQLRPLRIQTVIWELFFGFLSSIFNSGPIKKKRSDAIIPLYFVCSFVMSIRP